MEPQIPTVPTPPQPTAPSVSPLLPKKNNSVVILLSILLLVAISAVAFFALQTQKLTKEIKNSRSQNTTVSNNKACQPCQDKNDTSCLGGTSCFVADWIRGGLCLPILKIGQVYTPDQVNTECGTNYQSSPIPDPTANWKTYTNTTHGFSFKYPSDWILNSEGDGDQYNANLNLKKDNNVIGVIANMDGIGGGPRNVPFEEINLWGKTYYKQYGDINFSAGTKTVDICDSPHGLGVFQINNKTFMVSLTYQTNIEGEKPTLSIGKEFDQILSTFKFTD